MNQSHLPDSVESLNLDGLRRLKSLTIRTRFGYQTAETASYLTRVLNNVAANKTVRKIHLILDLDDFRPSNPSFTQAYTFRPDFIPHITDFSLTLEHFPIYAELEKAVVGPLKDFYQREFPWMKVYVATERHFPFAPHLCIV